MQTNYTIHIVLRCPARFGEVLADDMGSMELALENGLHDLLVELFGEGVIVDDVLVRQAPISGKAPQGLAFQL